MKEVCARLMGVPTPGRKTIVVAEVYEENEPQGMYIEILFDPDESITNLPPRGWPVFAGDYFMVERREMRISEHALWKPLLLCFTVPITA